MSTTTSQAHSLARTNKRHTVLKGLVFIFLAPYICLAACLGLYRFVEYVPHYLVPERPLLPGANNWSVMQQRFVQRGERRISIWQGEITVCEVPSAACAELSNAKVLGQIGQQYDKEEWEMITSVSDWRSSRCHDPELVSHKVDVVIRRPWLAHYVPTICVGVARLGQREFKIMVTTINPSFSSGWD